jgi:outer membrane protein assembly factor BamB
MSKLVVSVVAFVALAACSGPTGSPNPAQDWAMYGFDLHHTFSRADSPIQAKNATKLRPAWSFATGDAVSASPTVVAGVVYVGSWDGMFYALDLRKGTMAWQFQVDCQNSIIPVPPQCLAPGQLPPDRMDTDGGLITSSAAVVDGRVYFGGGRTMYCLDAATGALVWKRAICGKPEDPSCGSDAADPNLIFSSPTVFDGKVMFGTSPDGATGYRGGVVALSAADGTPLWRFETDPKLDTSGNPVVDSSGHVVAQNRGCGGVWSSGAIDEDARLVFFGTSDCNGDATPPFHESVLALGVDDGKPTWVFRPRTSDTCDFDFGASANVIDMGSQRYVGIGGKDGTYYMLQAASGQVAWKQNVVFGGNSGGFIAPAAFDGQHIYGGTGLGELGAAMPCHPSDPRDTQVQDPSFHAFAIADGSILWEQSMAYTFAPTTVADGVVFNGVGNALPPALRFYDAETGTKLGELAADGAVNSAAAVVGDMVVVGTGNSFDGAGGAVRAFQLH